MNTLSEDDIRYFARMEARSHGCTCGVDIEIKENTAPKLVLLHHEDDCPAVDRQQVMLEERIESQVIVRLALTEAEAQSLIGPATDPVAWRSAVEKLDAGLKAGMESRHGS